MNILFIVPYVPNLVRVRPYNLIRSLSARGHRLTVATLWGNEQERLAAEQLRADCHRVQAHHLPGWRSLLNCLTALPTPTPLQAAYSWQPVLAREIDQLVHHQNGQSGFDIIHIEHLRGVRYGLYLKSNQNASSKAKNGAHPPIIWDSVDSITHLFRQASLRSSRRASRWLTRFELRRTQRYEPWLLGQLDRVLVSSQVDRQAFLSLGLAKADPSKISVLTNGVDLSFFRPDENISRDPATLIVSGKMSYHANVTMVLHLVKEIMPLIWARRPEVKVCIVGKDPPRALRDLAANPAVSVTGTVPDIRPYLQRATIAVSPLLYGAGVQNKVLEAMACATPVIASPKAVAALSVQPGRDVLIAEEPGSFASTVLDLLDDSERQAQLGRSGRCYVEKYHHWENIAAQLEEIYTLTKNRK